MHSGKGKIPIMSSTDVMARPPSQSLDSDLEYLADLTIDPSSDYDVQSYRKDPHQQSTASGYQTGSKGVSRLLGKPDAMADKNEDRIGRFSSKRHPSQDAGSSPFKTTLGTPGVAGVFSGFSPIVQAPRTLSRTQPSQAKSLFPNGVAHDASCRLNTPRELTEIDLPGTSLLGSVTCLESLPSCEEVRGYGPPATYRQSNGVMSPSIRDSVNTAAHVLTREPHIGIPGVSKGQPLASVSTSIIAPGKVQDLEAYEDPAGSRSQQVQIYDTSKPVPGCKMRTYPCVPIALDFQERFPVLVDFLKRAVDNDPVLKLRTKDVNYWLTTCGKSPLDAHPTIIVFCTEDIFISLRKLFDRDSIRSQYGGKAPGLFSLKKFQRNTSHTPTVTPFKLVYWRTSATPTKRPSAQEPVEAQIDSFLTMCGSLIKIQHRTSTLSIVVRVDSKLYGMTVDHVRGIHDHSELSMKESAETASDARTMSSAEEFGKPVINSSTEGPYRSLERIEEEEEERDSVNIENLWIDDVEYDDLGNAEDGSDCCDLSKTPESPFDCNVRVVEETSTHGGEWENAGVLMQVPAAPQSTRPYLDWALIDFADQCYARPNALHSNDDSRPPKFLAGIAEGPEESPVPVVMISGATGIRRGLLLPGTSYLAGDPGQDMCQALVVEFSDPIGVIKGDCGSIVVNESTMNVYGHVVASNALGQAYIVPLRATLKQMADDFRAKKVDLPDPLYSLLELVVKYENNGRTDLAERAKAILTTIMLDRNVNILSTFRDALIEERVDMIEALLDAGLDVTDQQNEEGSPLKIAVLAGHETVVRILLQRGAKPLNSAAHLAAKEGHTGVLRMILDNMEKLSEELDSTTITSISNFGSALENQGKYPEAEELFDRLSAKVEREMGSEHPLTLSCFNNLAHVLEKRGEYEKAEVIHRRVAQMRAKIFGNIHADTLMSLNNLAHVLDNLGRYDEAERTHRHVLQERSKTLGYKHRDTMISISNLAELLENRGNYQAAEELNRQALSYREAELGPDHPDTLTSLTNLAQLLGKTGAIREAEDVARTAVMRFETTMGRDHPLTLISLGNLAQLLSTSARRHEAECLYREVLAGKETSLGPEHPSTLATVVNLSQLFERDERYSEAVQLNRQAMKTYEKTLGPEHILTLKSMHCLAHLHHRQKQERDAVVLYNKALAGYVEVLGVHHPITLECQSARAALKYEVERENTPVFTQPSALPPRLRAPSGILARLLPSTAIGIATNEPAMKPPSSSNWDIREGNMVSERPLPFIGPNYGHTI